MSIGFADEAKTHMYPRLGEKDDREAVDSTVYVHDLPEHPMAAVHDAPSIRPVGNRYSRAYDSAEGPQSATLPPKEGLAARLSRFQSTPDLPGGENSNSLGSSSAAGRLRNLFHHGTAGSKPSRASDEADERQGLVRSPLNDHQPDDAFDDDKHSDDSDASSDVWDEGRKLPTPL